MYMCKYDLHLTVYDWENADDGHLHELFKDQLSDLLDAGDLRISCDWEYDDEATAYEKTKNHHYA